MSLLSSPAPVVDQSYCKLLTPERSMKAICPHLQMGQTLACITHIWIVWDAIQTKLLRFEQPPPSTLTSLRPSNSTCLRTDLENSNIGSVNKSQAPSKHKPDGGLNEVAYSQPKATQKLPFPISRKTRGQPHCAPGGTLSKTRLASFSGGTLAGSTGE